MLKINYIIMIFFCVSITFCQHARVEVSPIAEQKKKTESKKERILLKQNYYLMGLFPRKIEYEESSLCPERGIKEIHQYSSFMNVLFEQMTLGIYSPRSLEIYCY
ncbi:Bor/Iss family lipoprotein [Leptospira stimsonii]|uniref:Lipoprotein n=1 Tax=Leptospira stimsonii TaxID=2202203 RepID=A0ABY2MUM8_9LEPT|nr:hypothetical protein [Leptospira stimsonii]TGK15410.1 hypothetical protein EHO98_14510 [Leptospira stimsonii]TGM08274.1 hypothetical protein EHQ90_22475 [Leptospira stimsonii]